MRAGIKRRSLDWERSRPVSSGQPWHTLIHTPNSSLKASGTWMSPWWVWNMTTQKHESEGDELLAGLSWAKFKLDDACRGGFRGGRRLAPLKNLQGTRKIDVVKAIYSLLLGTTTSNLIVPCHSKLQCNYIFNMSAHRPLRDPMRNV